MKLVVILIAIIALGGTLIGLGYAGIVNIPGITAPKKHAAAPPDAAQTTQPAPAATTPPAATTQPPAAAPAQPTGDIKPVKDGTDRLAKLWATLDAEALAKILQKWPDADSIAVLAKMDDEKLGKLLASLPPDKAVQLSRAIKSMPKGGK